MRREDFLFLTAGENPARVDRILGAIDVLLDAKAVGQIRKVVLDDAKFTLNRALSQAWDKQIYDPLFRGRVRVGKLPEPLWLATSSSLECHTIIPMRKKIVATKISAPEVTAALEFIDRVMPLVDAVNFLKAHVVKGRAPSQGPSKPANPDKVVKTCSCCFRKIAIVPETKRMAHHGYERPGGGYQTASCKGVDFQALEYSTEGLEWLIGQQTAKLADMRKQFRERCSLEKIVKPLDRTKPQMAFEYWTKGDPEWPEQFRLYVAKLEWRIKTWMTTIDELNRELEKWQSWHAAQAYALPEAADARAAGPMKM